MTGFRNSETFSAGDAGLSSEVIALNAAQNAERSGACTRCETLPPAVHGPGWLHLRFPLTHSLGKMTAFLRQNNVEFSADKGLLSIALPEHDLGEFARSVEQLFSPLELSDVRAVFEAKGENLEARDYLNSDSLEQFVARAQLDWLLDLMREERLLSHFQPILDARTGAIFAHEALLRGEEDAGMIPAPRILNTARGAGMMFQIDLAARRAAIRGAAIHGAHERVFINFMPTAIYDPKFCLRSTVALVKECGFRPEQIVFEVVESDHVEDRGHLASILDFYRESGFGVALDDLGAGYSSLNLLASLRPDFIKLDRELVMGVDDDPYRAILAAKLIEAARELGVKVVAEGIETRGEWEWLRDNGADYVQGYFFARPALPLPQVNFPL